MAVRIPVVAVATSLTLGGLAAAVPTAAWAEQPPPGSGRGKSGPDWLSGEVSAVVDVSGKVHLFRNGKPFGPEGNELAYAIQEVLDDRELPRDTRYDYSLRRIVPPPKDNVKVKASPTARDNEEERKKRLTNIGKAFAKDGPSLGQNAHRFGDSLARAANALTVHVDGNIIKVPVTSGSLQEIAMSVGFAVSAVGDWVGKRDARAADKASQGKIDGRTKRHARDAPDVVADAWRKESRFRQAQRDAAEKKRTNHPDADKAAKRAEKARAEARTAREKAEKYRQAYIRKAVSDLQAKVHSAKQTKLDADRRADLSRRNLLDAENDAKRGDPDGKTTVAPNGKIKEAKKELREAESDARDADKKLRALKDDLSKAGDQAKLDLLKRSRDGQRRPVDQPERKTGPAHRGDSDGPDDDPPATRTPTSKPPRHPGGGTGGQRTTETKDPEEQKGTTVTRRVNGSPTATTQKRPTGRTTKPMSPERARSIKKQEAIDREQNQLLRPGSDGKASRTAADRKTTGQPVKQPRVGSGVLRSGGLDAGFAILGAAAAKKAFPEQAKKVEAELQQMANKREEDLLRKVREKLADPARRSSYLRDHQATKNNPDLEKAGDLGSGVSPQFIKARNKLLDDALEEDRANRRRKDEIARWDSYVKAKEKEYQARQAAADFTKTSKEKDEREFAAATKLAKEQKKQAENLRKETEAKQNKAREALIADKKAVSEKVPTKKTTGTKTTTKKADDKKLTPAGKAQRNHALRKQNMPA